nr:TonB-dependent receptor [Asticcacaulis aquaticus]
MVSTTLCGALLSLAVPALVTAVATAVPTTALAQDLTSGTLGGTVKSEEGTPAAGATVTITGESTGYTGTATTDAEGKFQISQIPLGRYTVDITTKSGAKASETVLVTLGAVSSYDFTAGGSSIQTVVVRGKARRNLDFDRTTRGSVLDVQTLSERLPMGRSIEALADLVPGITINDVFGPPSIAGASPAENIYYVNGMNVTNFRNFLGGTTVPYDFYDQIEVKTGGYSAEYGRSTGGAFIATTRSGSNTFKGGVAYYYQPDSLATKGDFTYDKIYSQKTRKEYPTSSEANLWLSGPIIKDHIYFFGFYNPRDLQSEVNTYDTTSGKLLYKTTESREDPFWGGKLDFVLNPQHRLEYTYFNDDQSSVKPTLDTSTGKAPAVTRMSGGKTEIVKYTGKFTDWFTLSAMYGRSTYNQTSSSDVDSEANVYENGQVVRGNTDLLIETGTDDRKNYRVDADFYFNLAGKHHLKVGVDKEELHADAISSYSGGVYYRYYTGATSCGGTTITNCVRVRKLFSGGAFDVENQAFYIQDSWEITDRLALNLGLRSDNFDNMNAAGKSFLKMENKVAPRIGISYDPTGDKSSKLTAFYGRYYLPVAANTNIRMAGGENFTQDWYSYTGRNATTLVPTLGTLYLHEVLSDGTVPDAGTLVSQNLEPQYQDEFIVGYEKRLDSGWKVGVDFTYRKLSAVMEDADVDMTNAAAYLVSKGVITQAQANSGSFGSSGYVLLNPGKDLVVALGDSFGAAAGKVVTISADALGFPEAKRNYQALTFSAERPWDGTWYLGGSLTLSRTVGNIEGGVKSDNGQDDTGLTQDFDEPGWTDGSYGLLPNHHGYNLKLYGSYEFSENLRGGFNANILSPRHYGCIGAYPLNDGRAVATTITAWYCGGKLTPRGESFSGDWIKKLDVNLTWTQPIPIGTVKVTADVFNVFNFQGAEQYVETGDISLTSRNPNYGSPSSYQNPRYVRIGLKYEF